MSDGREEREDEKTRREQERKKARTNNDDWLERDHEGKADEWQPERSDS